MDSVYNLHQDWHSRLQADGGYIHLPSNPLDHASVSLHQICSSCSSIVHTHQMLNYIESGAVAKLGRQKKVRLTTG